MDRLDPCLISALCWDYLRIGTLSAIAKESEGQDGYRMRNVLTPDPSLEAADAAIARGRVGC